MKYSAISTIFCLFCFVSSCESSRFSIRDTMTLAGENRCELDSVLRHYRKVSPDADKHKAAKYLIRNISFHQSFEADVYREYCDSLIVLFSSNLPESYIVQEAQCIKEHFRGRLNKVPDARSLTAEYLIWNIDTSFSIWRNSPFLEHISFDEMCECVLPYKCYEGQPIDKWKTYSRLPKGSELEQMQQIDEYRHAPCAAAEMISDYYSQFIQNRKYSVDGLQDLFAYDFELMKVLPFGTCSEFSSIDIIAERANGVPVYTDFTPNWPYMSSSHYWSLVRNRNRKDIDYLALERKPEDPHYDNYRHAKVFRRTFAPNMDLVRAMRRGEQIPSSLEDVKFAIDVTELYANTFDVSIKVDTKARGHKYAFLSVFDCSQWKAVGYGRIRFGKAFFPKIGYDNLYLITVTDSAGKLIPVSDPFVLDCHGKVSYIHPNESRRVQSVHLTRKYQAQWHIWKVRNRIRGGAIDVADKRDLSDAHQVGEFPRESVFSVELMITDSLPHRYWRVRATKEDTTYFAELYFYVNGHIRKPEILSYTGGVDERHAIRVIDGDSDKSSGVARDGYIAFDFGEPVKVDRVACIKRGDDNGIKPGDEYALFAWQDGMWSLIDIKIANDISITFDNVPCDALLYIKDLTHGKENRPFIFKDGRLTWY